MVDVLRCGACGVLDPGPREICPACHAHAMESTSVPGIGTVLSFTTIRRPPTSFRAEGPYHIGVVDLDAGLRVTARLQSPVTDLVPGARVQCIDTNGAAPTFKEFKE